MIEEVIDKRECIMGLTMGQGGQCLNKGELLKSCAVRRAGLGQRGQQKHILIVV